MSRVAHARRGRRSLGRQHGFTLIELIVSMAIAAIIAGFIGMFMATPMEAYFAQTRRAALADAADAIVRAFDQDVPTALPNSVRITYNGAVTAVEMLATADSARYWASAETTALAPPAGAARELDFTSADGQFAIDGLFNGALVGPASTAVRLVVLGGPGADAYQQPAVMTPVGTSITLLNGGEGSVTLAPAFQFGAPSPSHAVFVVTQPVSYLCNRTAGTITRYTGYSIAADPTTRDSAAELIAAGAAQPSVVTQLVSTCQFVYSAGTAYHGGLLSLAVTLVKDAETFQLFHQTALEKVP